MSSLATLMRSGVLTLDSAAAVELLGELPPDDRPAVVIVPRNGGRPETTVRRPSVHERSLRAADALGRASATLEQSDTWRRRR